MDDVIVGHIYKAGVIGIAIIYGVLYFVLDAAGKKNRELAEKAKSVAQGK